MKPKFWEPSSVLSSWSHTLACANFTSGDSARTISPSTGFAVTVPELCGSPPEIPKSAAPATGVLSTRISIELTALLPALRWSASTAAGVIDWGEKPPAPPGENPIGAAEAAAGVAAGDATSGAGTASRWGSTGGT